MRFFVLALLSVVLFSTFSSAAVTDSHKNVVQPLISLKLNNNDEVGEIINDFPFSYLHGPLNMP